MSTVDDKSIVQEYFNATGFDRWKRIYGDSEVNKVQLDIRKGHQLTVDTVLEWLQQDAQLKELSICDAGCGVGSVAIPLASIGAKVYASDISTKMIEEAQQRAEAILPSENLPTFEVHDLETLSGKYDTVICLDVLIHYPQDKAKAMINHLSSLAKSRLILSFAPKTTFYSLLKKVGDFFPGPSKATRAYLHTEGSIIQALIDNGWQINRKTMNKTRFYFSRVIEAKR